MMSRPFNVSGARPSVSCDFMMMNNNYLPGVSRLNNTEQLAYSSNMTTAFPTSLNMTNVDRSLIPNIADGQNCAVNTNRISVNPAGGIHFNNIGTGLTPVLGADSSQVEMAGMGDMETKPLDLCENQGPVIAQNSNISQNSGWSNIYNPKRSLEQICTSNFTFTTPTQSYLHSPALTVTTSNRFQYTRTRPQTFAPGCNTPWQHSSPKRLPPVRQRSFSSPQPISVFTGSQADSSVLLPDNALGATNAYFPSQWNEPVASCSELGRRLKRRHTVDMADEFSPRNKIHLTEEKISNHMKELSLHNLSRPPETSVPAGEPIEDSPEEIIQLSDTCYPQQSQSNGCGTEMLKHSERQWHDFKLLEEKLEMIDEDLSSESEKPSLSEPVVRITEGIQIKPHPVLPQDILDKIRNPCQEVILWSPPNAAMKKTLPSEDVTANNIQTDSVNMIEDDTVNETTQSNTQTAAEDSGMETEPEDVDL